jgi:hypothetical protein
MTTTYEPVTTDASESVAGDLLVGCAPSWSAYQEQVRARAAGCRLRLVEEGGQYWLRGVIPSRPGPAGRAGRTLEQIDRELDWLNWRHREVDRLAWR